MLDKEYFQDLNESIQVKTAYQDFKSYRVDLTRFIKDVIKRYESKKMLVFGAGNLMDIDYRLLSPLVSETMLTDIDEKAIRRGLEFYKLSEAGIHYACFDYLKNSDRDDYLDDLGQVRVSEGHGDEGYSSLTHLCEGQGAKTDIGEAHGDYEYIKASTSYDLAIVCPIHTQFYDYHQDRIGDLQAMTHLIDDFNKKVMNTLKKGGILIALADIMEVTREELMTMDKTHKNWIEDSIHKYEETYGYGLGSYGLYSFQQLGNSIAEDYFYWQFDKERHFLVKSLLIQNSRFNK